MKTEKQIAKKFQTLVKRQENKRNKIRANINKLNIEFEHTADGLIALMSELEKRFVDIAWNIAVKEHIPPKVSEEEFSDAFDVVVYEKGLSLHWETVVPYNKIDYFIPYAKLLKEEAKLLKESLEN